MVKLRVLCQCGCGKEITPCRGHRYRTPRFISGHNDKWVNRREPTQNYAPRVCGCGCGQPTKPTRKRNERGYGNGEYSEYLRGHYARVRNVQPDFRDAVSTAHKGRKRKPRTTEHKANLKAAVFDKPRPKVAGAKNPAWRGGAPRRRGWQMTAWAKAVKRRDGRKCVECGSTASLHAHHVKPFVTYPEGRYDVANGVTLCQRCHVALHAGTPLSGSTTSPDSDQRLL